MKSLLAAVVGVLSLGGISCATAQSRATPASDWTGFYAGAGVGLRSTQIDASTISEVVVGTGQDFLSLACSGGFGFFPSCAGQSLNSTGFRFDPYLGYNWQFATHWLVGLEGDFGIGNNLDTLNGMAYPGGGIFNSGLSGDSFTVKAGWDERASAISCLRPFSSTLPAVQPGSGSRQRRSAPMHVFAQGDYFFLRLAHSG
jgi:outer membrane immunogenic protein